MLDFKDNDVFTINKGKYEGTKFRFNTVGFEEDKENDRLVLKFDYDILESKVEVDHNEFTQFAGDLLVDILGEGEIVKHETN